MPLFIYFNISMFLFVISSIIQKENLQYIPFFSNPKNCLEYSGNIYPLVILSRLEFLILK